jgi:hypothetical protein
MLSLLIWIIQKQKMEGNCTQKNLDRSLLQNMGYIDNNKNITYSLSQSSCSCSQSPKLNNY